MSTSSRSSQGGSPRSSQGRSPRSDRQEVTRRDSLGFSVVAGSFVVYGSSAPAGTMQSIRPSAPSMELPWTALATQQDEQAAQNNPNSTTARPGVLYNLSGVNGHFVVNGNRTELHVYESGSQERDIKLIDGEVMSSMTDPCLPTVLKLTDSNQISGDVNYCVNYRTEGGAARVYNGQIKIENGKILPNGEGSLIFPHTDASAPEYMRGTSLAGFWLGGELLNGAGIITKLSAIDFQ
ncbi:MAG: hypothetical protein V4591_01485 [Bdellovibrionota bacterium]